MITTVMCKSEFCNHTAHIGDILYMFVLFLLETVKTSTEEQHINFIEIT